MNEIKIEVNFAEGLCYVTSINLITNDYNSTKCTFTFDKNTGTKLFKMKNPNGEAVLIKEISDNEVILVGETESGEKASIFTMAGDYPFEIAMYDNDGRLTSASNVLSVVEEQIKVEDSEEIVAYKPLFDELLEKASNTLNKANEVLETAENASQTASEAAQTAEEAATTIEELISQTNEALTNVEIALQETDNLDIESQQLSNGANIIITKKDGTTKTTTIYNGEDGSEYDDTELKKEIEQVKQNFINYYLKNETYSKEEVNTLIGNIEKVTMTFVDELPTTGESNIIYFVPGEDSEEGNVYDEYAYANGSWEKIGSTAIDLSNYYNKNEIDILLTRKQDIIQYTEMPAASEDNLGSIIQYIGETTDDYTNGYFYKCIVNDDVYSWENVEVQENIHSNYYIDGDYLIYQVPVGNYALAQDNNGYSDFSLSTNAANAIGEAFTLAYKNNKYLILKIISLRYYPIWEYIYPFINKPNGKGSSAIAYGSTYIASSGNIWQSGNLTIRYTITNGIYSVTGARIAGSSHIGLGTGNTDAYTPTRDYHPATKKYVDDKPTTYSGYDATKTQTLKNVNGTLTWVDDE